MRMGWTAQTQRKEVSSDVKHMCVLQKFRGSAFKVQGSDRNYQCTIISFVTKNEILSFFYPHVV